jgi:hypothetical protein
MCKVDISLFFEVMRLMFYTTNKGYHINGPSCEVQKVYMNTQENWFSTSFYLSVSPATIT